MNHYIKIFIIFQILITASVPAIAAPDLMNIEAGMASINTQNRTTIIDQTSDKAIINWNHFDIGSDEIVQFKQPTAHSFTLNRVPNNFAPTSIFGVLNANGNIAIINPRGIVFGNTSRINTGGFIASTKDILSNDVMDNNTLLTLSRQENYTGIITLDGDIRTNKTGKIIVNADDINIAGAITGDLSQIVLTTADQLIFDLSNGRNELELIISAGDININNTSIKSNHADINIIAGQDINLENSVINSGEKNIVIEALSNIRADQSKLQSTGGDIRLTSDAYNGLVELNDTIIASKGKNNLGVIDIRAEAVGENDLGSPERFNLQNFVIEGDKGGNITITTGRVVGNDNCIVIGTPAGCGSGFETAEFEVDQMRIEAEQKYETSIKNTNKRMINEMRRTHKIHQTNQGSQDTSNEFEIKLTADNEVSLNDED